MATESPDLDEIGADPDSVSGKPPGDEPNNSGNNALLTMSSDQANMVGLDSVSDGDKCTLECEINRDPNGSDLALKVIKATPMMKPTAKPMKTLRERGIMTPKDAMQDDED